MENTETKNNKPTKEVSFKDLKFTDKCKWLIHHCQLPERKVNKEYPFLFKIYNYKTDGMIFLFTALVIPLVVLFVLAFAANMGQDYRGGHAAKITMNGADASPLILMVVTVISNLIGFLIFWQRDSRVVMKSGFFVFYAFIFVVDIVMIIASIILGLAVPKNSDGKVDTNGYGYQVASFWFQILAEVIVIYMAFRHTKNLKERFITTLKENWRMWLITTVITGALLFVFITYVMPNIFKGVRPIHQQSTNENTLEAFMKDGSVGRKVGYTITLFVLTILVAPITEELATRNAFFVGVSNKTIAVFTAALYFAMLHVQAGDVEHILNYFVGGLFLSGVFSISRGNVTYDTGTHMFYNFISFIVICATDLPK